jgi:ubiquinone/menaquinone biosynthesis C-methylase UbiE
MGYFPKFFKNITAIDKEVYSTWDSNRINWLQCDAEHLPFKDESFDIVFMKETLQYVDPLKTLREMIRISKKRVIIIAPNCNNPLYRLRRRIGALPLTKRLSYLKIENFEKILASEAPGHETEIYTLEAHYHHLWLVRVALDVLGHLMKLPGLQKLNSHFVVVVDKKR